MIFFNPPVGCVTDTVFRALYSCCFFLILFYFFSFLHCNFFDLCFSFFFVIEMFFYFLIFFEEEGVDLLYLDMFIVEERLKILELFQGEIVVAALDFAYL